MSRRIDVLEEILKELKQEQKETGDYLWRNTSGYKNMYQILGELILNERSKKSS